MIAPDGSTCWKCGVPLRTEYELDAVACLACESCPCGRSETHPPTCPASPYYDDDDPDRPCGCTRPAPVEYSADRLVQLSRLFRAQLDLPYYPNIAPRIETADDVRHLDAVADASERWSATLRQLIGY